MNSNINPMQMQMIQFIRQGGNPQQFVMNILQQQSNNNPMAANLLNLAKSNRTSDIEQIARNMLKEQGKDFDKEFANFKQMFGL